jgi:hypothetical protein
MKSGETVLVLRTIMTKGVPAMALLGVVACATTSTTPVSRQADPAFARKVVAYPTPVSPGTIVIDPGSHFLYLVQGGGQAIRYGVGVGGEGFGWSGSATVHNKQEWPDWYPPPEMLQRKPELRQHMTQLQSGIGMPGGPENPIGARALYLWAQDAEGRCYGSRRVSLSVRLSCTAAAAFLVLLERLLAPQYPPLPSEIPKFLFSSPSGSAKSLLLPNWRFLLWPRNQSAAHGQRLTFVC